MDALKQIAHIETDFATKFGVPRQSGLVQCLEGRIVFAPEYRDPEALRGIEGFSHLWLLWGFSEVDASKPFSPTVRPPRLGGNARMGVFATRSPFRPNPIGLSCVELAGVEMHPKHGPVLHVLGADMMDGTPIYDIKPYLPYADCRKDATGGFAGGEPPRLTVEIPPQLLQKLPQAKHEVLAQVLAQDPRPPYQQSPGRVYGMQFAGQEVKFTVEDTTLRVVAVE